MKAQSINQLLFAVIALLLTLSRAAFAADPQIRIAADPRVELLSIVFRLAGNPEYNQGRLSAYLNDIDAHFAPHRDHPVIKHAQQLRNKRGISFDAVMSMAIHLSDVQTLQERVPFDSPDSSLEKRWTAKDARQFLEHLRDFVNVSNFNAFLAQHQPLYDSATQQMQIMLDEHAQLNWFEQFFGEAPTAPFFIIPAPVNGGQAYGPSIQLANGTRELYAILGVWQVDDAGNPKIDRTVLPTVIHEFCHSFVNHLVEKHENDLRDAGHTIFPLVETAMKKQAYGNWITMLQESLVRAAVIHYLKAHDRAAVEKETQDQLARGFVWMPSLVELLDEYAADRKQWPKFEDFMPRVVEYYNKRAPLLKKEFAEREGKRPALVSMLPANGSKDVDPSTHTITFRFDRPMQRNSFSVMFTSAGPSACPKITSVSFDEAGLVFTMQVQLEPGRSYEFTLNNETGGGFKSTQGVPLKMTIVRFETGE